MESAVADVSKAGSSLTKSIPGSRDIAAHRILAARGDFSMQPSTAQSTQSAESIDAVLGRFQVWSDSRNTDSHKTKDMTDGIRELSYEDALQFSPYRWQARAEAPGIVAPGKVDPVLEPAEDTPAHPAPVFQNPKNRTLLSDDVYETQLWRPIP
ncbi:MAG TPA: hypothetical protein VK729_10485 [Silvibacterium sp.]|nr:hypothetical protein [Silvibacterium sp.]